MNRLQFGEGACEKTRRYMDAYVSNELLVETTQDLLKHLEACAGCASELEARTRLRGLLKSAVQRQSVPPELPALVRARIRGRASVGWFGGSWSSYAMASVAVAALCAAVWLRPVGTRLPDLSDRTAQATYIQQVSARVGQIFRPGLNDHIHCALFRKYPTNPPPIQEMEEKLGPEYKALLPLVEPAVPPGYRVVLAHQCSYAGRHFIHLTLRKGEDVISLVISRKNDGETFTALSPSVSASGVPLYEASTGSYQVAGFESEHYLAFVVSDLKAGANLEIASTVAPAVRKLLS